MLVRGVDFFSAQLQNPPVGPSQSVSAVRAKGSHLPLIKILRALRIFGLAFIPMESPTKRVSIGSDEQRNERAFGTLAGSETIWSL